MNSLDPRRLNVSVPTIIHRDGYPPVGEFGFYRGRPVFVVKSGPRLIVENRDGTRVNIPANWLRDR